MRRSVCAGSCVPLTHGGGASFHRQIVELIETAGSMFAYFFVFFSSRIHIQELPLHPEPRLQDVPGPDHSNSFTGDQSGRLLEEPSAGPVQGLKMVWRLCGTFEYREGKSSSVQTSPMYSAVNLTNLGLTEEPALTEETGASARPGLGHKVTLESRNTVARTRPDHGALRGTSTSRTNASPDPGLR